MGAWKKDHISLNRTIKSAVKYFRDFIKKREIESFEMFEKEDLNDYLSSFYPSTRKANGEQFKRIKSDSVTLAALGFHPHAYYLSRLNRHVTLTPGQHLYIAIFIV